MKNTNKILIRTILVTTYIMVIGVVLFLISGILSYLNTGADRSKMLHTQVFKERVYQPKITWKKDGNEGRKISEQVVNEIEKNYLDAWYVKQVAYKENNIKGVEDFYTKSVRKNIYKNITDNKKKDISVIATTLSHNPDILFYSEDGKLVVLEDKNVVEYKKVMHQKQQIIETTELNNYKHILLLEDGFWRVRHTVKEASSNYLKTIKATKTDTLQIKGINYYPKETPWNFYSDDFNITVIKNDFKLLKKIGLNSIRIFVPYEDFGKSNVKKEKLKKLEMVLDAAAKHHLKVVVTLFDFYGNYDVLDWTLTYKHAKTIVETFKNHNSILAWDLKNEPDLDFNSRGKDKVIAWLENLLILVKSIDKKHPITIGWSNIASATILKDKLDYVSFHYYEEVHQFERQYLELKNKIPNKPLILQEFGLSSYRGFWRPFASSEKKQADYHKTIQDIIAKNNINFMSWTLYDFEEVPSSVVGSLPWRTNPQKKFGFIRSDGTKKPSFKYIVNP